MIFAFRSDVYSENLAIFYKKNQNLSYETEVPRNHVDIRILFPEPVNTGFLGIYIAKLTMKCKLKFGVWTLIECSRT